MEKVNDKQLITEAREWESVAEKLNYKNSVLFTVTDALSLHSIPELSSVQKLIETAADELYTLYRECEKKHKAITESRFEGEEVTRG